ncbi:hypothetical protein [Aquiflexum gelatinilyticum]|uniref:Uncharacterized protein n=1 Tax=Aquiflexum gelatinilyticum TaxID=2961943 RepID=A0A9X2T1B5_9BACT|nr:hypothetical protein [Aquiflexum gelatinilyticum]MCR9015741.1 hypothetical protein [Aquiflexum gelatinilyticum]
MKKTFLLFLSIIFISNSFASDIIYLKDGSKIKGDLISVDVNELTFKSAKKNQKLLKLKSEEVEFVKVEDYEKLVEVQESMYLKGMNDAQIHHKRFGGNFCAGLFGGVIGFVIVAVTDAKSPNPLLVGEENFKSMEYREGYNKKAKGKNLGAAGVGWAVSFLVLLVLISSGS